MLAGGTIVECKPVICAWKWSLRTVWGTFSLLTFHWLLSPHLSIFFIESAEEQPWFFQIKFWFIFCPKIRKMMCQLKLLSVMETNGCPSCLSAKSMWRRHSFEVCTQWAFDFLFFQACDGHQFCALHLTDLIWQFVKGHVLKQFCWWTFEEEENHSLLNWQNCITLMFQPNSCHWLVHAASACSR